MTPPWLLAWGWADEESMLALIGLGQCVPCWAGAGGLQHRSNVQAAGPARAVHHQQSMELRNHVAFLALNPEHPGFLSQDLEVAKLETDARQHLILFVNTQITVVSAASQRAFISRCSLLCVWPFIFNITTHSSTPDLDHRRVTHSRERSSTDSRALLDWQHLGCFQFPFS